MCRRSRSVVVALTSACALGTGCLDDKAAQAPSVVLSQSLSASTLERTMNTDNAMRVVALPDTDVAVLSELLRAVLRVVSSDRSPEQERAILGVGSDHVPKGPGPVLRRYYEKPFRGDAIEIAFERQGAAAPWSKSSFGVRPPGYPQEVFSMKLNPAFFEGMQLVKAEEQIRPEERLARLVVYTYRTRSAGHPLEVRFECHPALTRLEATHPNSFHKVVVVRVEV